MPPSALIWSNNRAPALSATVPNLAAPPDMKSTIAIFSSDGFCPPPPAPPGAQALASRTATRAKERSRGTCVTFIEVASIELAEATGTHGPSLERLLRALVSFGVLSEPEAGRFGLTPLGELLRSDVPHS